MNKRLISILLVVMMVFTLLPMTALADDVKGEGTGDVAVIVYGKAISEAFWAEETTLDTLTERITTNLQDALAGEHLPDCTFTLSGNGISKTLKKDNSLSIISSMQFSNDKSEFFDVLVNSIKDMIGEGLAKPEIAELLKDAFVIYSAKDVPVGTYTLAVENIDANGYNLIKPESGSVQVTVVENSTTFAGVPKEFSSSSVVKRIADKIKNSQNSHWLDPFGVAQSLAGLAVDAIIEKLPTISVEFPGYWLHRVDPGFKFIKTDLADKPLPGAEFLMVDRNETIKIVKAMAALGKDTFTNAMKLVGTEGFTWEELSILNAGLISRDEETNQIGLDPVAAEKLVTTYWSLVEASAKMPIKDFLKEDLRVPALLKATSNDDGIVNFTEDSNITLVWSINVLMKIAGVSNDWIQNLDEENLDFDNKELKAVMEVIIPIVKAASAAGITITETTGELAKGFINDWIYPVLQNDEIPKKLSETLKTLGGEEDENELTWKDFIPDHAILTPKMPASDYILMEEKAPEGYMRNPIFYTIHLTWDTEQEDVSKWCYVTVADIGIIGPYLAENYYTFFRNNSFVSVSDKILNRVMGKDVNVLEWVLANEEGATAATLDYWAKLISANMAGDSENGSEEAVANELAQYVIKHGDNVQSLMHFAYTVANRRRAVISSEVNEEWHFYNFNDSIHTSYATRITALLEGAKASIKNDTLVGQATKAVIQAQIDTVAAVDKTITSITARYTAAVKEAVGKVADSVKSSATEAAKSVVSSLLKRLFK